MNNDYFLSGNKVSEKDKILRFLRDSIFLANRVEEKIYQRRFLSSCFELRMLSESIRELLYYSIKYSGNQKKWNDNISKSWKKKLDKEKGNKGVSFIVPTFKFLFGSYPYEISNFLDKYSDLYEIGKISDSMNKWLHYNVDTNYLKENNARNENDKSTLYVHRNEIRFHEPKMNEVIDYLNFLFNVMKMIFEKIFSINLLNLNFESKIYNDKDIAIQVFKENAYIFDFLSQNKCYFCKDGKMTFSDKDHPETNFPYGAYVTCNQDSCKARLNLTLKINKNINDVICPKCGKIEVVQKRFNLKENIEYQACKECGWNNKK